MNPTQTNNQTSALPYDIAPLKQGVLYEKSRAKYVYVIVIVGIILFQLIFAAALTNADHMITSRLQSVVAFIPVLIFTAALASIIVPFVAKRRYIRAVQAFALLNNLVAATDEELYGSIPANLQVSGAHSRKVSGYRFTFGSVPAVLFDYWFTTGSGKSSQSFHYAIASMTLTKDFPHLYLDGKVNGSNSQYEKEQRVELEGDFNKYFTLYMPEGSAAGALTVLSPDIMQTVIAQGQALDLEIDGHEAAASTAGYAFSRENFQRLVNCCNALSKELSELEVTWQPFLQASGQPYELKKTNRIWPAILAIGLYVVITIIRIINHH